MAFNETVSQLNRRAEKHFEKEKEKKKTPQKTSMFGTVNIVTQGMLASLLYMLSAFSYC